MIETTEGVQLLKQILAVGGVSTLIALGVWWYATKHTPTWIAFLDKRADLAREREQALTEAQVTHLDRMDRELERLRAEIVSQRSEIAGLRKEVRDCHANSEAQAIRLATLEATVQFGGRRVTDP